MRVLILTIEAFGGLGGIAKYNRDLANALVARPDCTEIVILPRLMRLDPETVPDKIVQDDRAIGGKGRFLLRCLYWLVFGGRFDAIICGHLNLLPFAVLWRLRGGPPAIIELYGIDAWQPNPRRLVNFLADRVSHFITISTVTLDRFNSWSRLDPAKGFILPPCIDATGYGPGPKPPSLMTQYWLDAKRVVLMLARMESD